MKTSKFTIFGILGMLTLVILASGCTTSTKEKNATTTTEKNNTMSYTGNGYTFNYPVGWSVMSPQNDTRVVMKDGATNIQFSITTVPAVVAQAEFEPAAGWKEISTSKVTVDGTTAKQTVFTYTQDDVLMRHVTIIFAKNEKGFVLSEIAPDSEFDKYKADFETMLNSFKVQ